MAISAVTFAQAKISLPKFFSDNMVLQQQSECSIWGKADKGTCFKEATDACMDAHS